MCVGSRQMPVAPCLGPSTVYTASVLYKKTGAHAMKPLTPRQAEVLELIKANMNETGMPPTRAEIAQKLGFKSANAAEEHLKALAKKGVIEIMPGTSRGIRLLLEEEDVQPEENGLPLIGKVAAGEPILAQEHIESHYQVDPALFHPRADFLLRVQGMSMKNIGIMDGDLLAVHKTRRYATARSWWHVWTRTSPSSASSARAARCGCCRKTKSSPPSRWISPVSTLP